MGEWRRPKGQRKRESDRWDPSGSNNRYRYHGKPPRFPDEKTEMHWEEKFCLTNGVRWEKLLETKRYLYQYSDITSWDDSAGKEAFDNAKARYWAQINGLQSEIPLPDPNMLIDIIDHEAPPSNLKLYENLHGSLSEDEADSVNDCSTDGWSDGGVILWDSHYAKKEEEVVWGDFSTGWGDNHPINPTGWGDNYPVNPNGWGDNRPINPSGWGDNHPINPTGWGDNYPSNPIGWGDNQPINPTGWGDNHLFNPSTYEGIIPTGWGEAEEGPRGQWNGGDANCWNYGMNSGNHQNSYRFGASGQHWNYWNNGGYNAGNWGNYYGRNCPEVYNSNESGQSGYNKIGNIKNYNSKSKQWKKKENSSRPFCAPLNPSSQSNDGWNVPRSVA